MRGPGWKDPNGMKEKESFSARLSRPGFMRTIGRKSDSCARLTKMKSLKDDYQLQNPVQFKGKHQVGGNNVVEQFGA